MALQSDVSRLVNLGGEVVRPVLDILLRDMTTGQNIMFCTDNYSDAGYGMNDEITLDALERIDIVSRTEKAAAVQTKRKKEKAEVFTPAWAVNKMNNMADDMWFERKGVFNTEHDDHTWTTNTEPQDYGDWQKYVDSPRLEITCGEAPYLTMRYDAASGERIGVDNRMGILDRKLTVVFSSVDDHDERLAWSLRALSACYGYEWQGDSLLLARANMLLSFYDFCRDESRMNFEPDDELLARAADIISWNLVQMDGLTGTVPGTNIRCNTMDWRNGRCDLFYGEEFDRHLEQQRPKRRRRA